MSVAGPSGSGKIRLLSKCLSHQRHSNELSEKLTIWEYQHLCKEIPDKIEDIEFLPCLEFEMIKNLESCLLVFDDSCEAIYQEKEFVKLAVSGRHQEVKCIFVKNNLFHQSKWSRTIDINTTLIILFKAPRDVQEVFGRQMNNTEFIRDCYKMATIEPFGHFMIDFDPRTSDSFRYCSNIVGLGPTDFYIPPSLAKETPLTNEREKLAYTEALAENQEKQTFAKNFA